MLDFVKRAFRGLMEVVLWLNLVVCSIGIAVLWHSVWLPGRGFVGFIIGVIVGLLVNIVLGGFVATFLEMGEDVAQMKRKLDNLKAGSFANGSGAGNPAQCVYQSPTVSNGNAGASASRPPLETDAASDVAETWLCKHCGNENPSKVSTCKKCHHYNQNN